MFEHMAFGTDGRTDRRFADLGPIEHLFFLPRERCIMDFNNTKKAWERKISSKNSTSYLLKGRSSERISDRVVRLDAVLRTVLF